MTYEVEITRYNEGNWDKAPVKHDGCITWAGIVVKPPLTVSPLFEKIILGSRESDASVHFVFSTNEASVFVLESHRDDTSINERMKDVARLAERIIDLANYPEQTLSWTGDPFDPDYDQEDLIT